jgi:anti-sigma B factor antagonist
MQYKPQKVNNMNMTELTCNEYQLVSLEGDFDAGAVILHKERFEQFIEYKSRGIVFDMSDVSFLDSSGIGAMVFLFKRLKSESRDLNIIGLNGQPERLIQLLRIDQTISTFDDLKSFLITH